MSLSSRYAEREKINTVSKIYRADLYDSDEPFAAIFVTHMCARQLHLHSQSTLVAATISVHLLLKQPAQRSACEHSTQLHPCLEFILLRNGACF